VSWAETGPGSGEYTATYTAAQSGEGYTATLKLSGWSGKASDKYNITAGEASESKSGITRDQATYTAGDAVKVTVTLKDAHDNPVSGQAAVLGDTTVTVRGTSNTPDVSWAETGPGSGEYTATYTAAQSGEGYTATLKLSGWSGPKQSGTYDIVADNKITGLIADGHEFGPDEGFPTTGFSGATFTIKLEKDNPGDYTWTASPDWVTVSDKGEVTLKQGKPGQVKITGKHRNGGGTALEYAFVVRHWFSAHEQSAPTPLDPGQVCTNVGAGHEVGALVAEGGGQRREVGTLGGEWNGDLEGMVVDASAIMYSGSGSKVELRWGRVVNTSEKRKPVMLYLGSQGVYLVGHPLPVDEGGWVSWSGSYVCQLDQS
ncbi:hypothetical protein ACLEVL_24795, partial [Enterobacter ludwigii]